MSEREGEREIERKGAPSTVASVNIDDRAMRLGDQEFSPNVVESGERGHRAQTVLKKKTGDEGR